MKEGDTVVTRHVGAAGAVGAGWVERRERTMAQEVRAAHAAAMRSVEEAQAGVDFAFAALRQAKEVYKQAKISADALSVLVVKYSDREY